LEGQLKLPVIVPGGKKAVGLPDVVFEQESRFELTLTVDFRLGEAAT